MFLPHPTPDTAAYWFEPGLPWLTRAVEQSPPLGHDKIRLLWHIGVVAADTMLPRFPQGCRLNDGPVLTRAQLTIGRVYAYHHVTGTRVLGRLAYIGATYLGTTLDSAPYCSIWPLRPDEHQATWDVREITHYVSWPCR